MNHYSLAEQYQVRVDERTGLKALFEKVFFDVAYAAEGIQALERTKFQPLPGPEERGDEADEKTDFVDSPRTILLYRGESGIGKTRIFRQFRANAEERQIPVYEIHCYDVEGIPFKPFLRVIREILRDFKFGEMLREKYRPGLERLLPEIFHKGTVGEGGAEALDWEKKESWEEDKLRIFDGITQLLFEITASHPVVILVHDLNWGDQGTIELLRYIGRNIQLRNRPFWTGADQQTSADLDWPPDESSLDDPERLDLKSPSSRNSLWTFLDTNQRPPRSAKAAEGNQKSVDNTLEDAEQNPVRLMILANYEGAKSEDDYCEQSLRSLGKEPFAYHAEIRALDLEETKKYVEHSCARISEAGVELAEEAVARIYHYSEGSPSYVHEILHLILEREPEILAPGGDRRHMRLTAEMVESAMAGSVTETETLPEVDDKQQPEQPQEGQPEEERSDDAVAAAPPEVAAVAGPEEDRRPLRYGILERRLSRLDLSELAVLQAMALARKPLTRGLLARVLDLPVATLEEKLEALERRCLIEKVGQLFVPHGGEKDGYVFRMWDYSEVVSATISDPEVRTDLHQRLGTEICRHLSTSGEEKAFEVFYHLLRGTQPRSSLDYGLTAARRFASSFSIQKAVRVLDDLLRILEEKDDLETRLTVLEKKAAYYLSLEDFKSAGAALKQLFSEAGQSLEEARLAELLIRRSEIYRLSNDTNHALKVLSKAFKHIRDAHSLLAVRWHFGSARVRKDRNDVKRAVNLCLKGIKICQKYLETLSESEAGSPPPELCELSQLYRLLAQTFWLRGDDTHAADNFQKSLDGFERLGDEAASAKVLDDLGNVYLERGNYFRAARYFYKALEVKRRNQDIHGLCKSYDRLGLVYLGTGDEIKTIGLLNHSIRLKERIGDLKELNPTLEILGDLYFRLGRYQKAIAYFQREIQNSEVLSDTDGLVKAFIHMGRTYYAIGDSAQVEKLTRQIGILSTEFKLKSQEADGALLRGVYETGRRNWDEAETQLKSAYEIYSKLGSRRQETEALLEQAELKCARENYNDAFKLVSKGLVLAEQLKAVDLQVRALNIKGNVYRFIKGGNLEKAKELLRSALELVQIVNDVHLRFEIYYSLAKVYHYDREFVEAGNFYGKAEALLRRIAEDLPDDQAVRYLEHPRRKVFLEDANRYRKEVKGRSATETVGDPRERLTSFSVTDFTDRRLDFKDLSARVLRVNAAQHSRDFFSVLLREAADLTKSERSFILRVHNRQYFRVAQMGFGDNPEEDPDFPSAQAVTEEALRKGKSVLLSGPEEWEKDWKLPQAGTLSQKALLVVPLMTQERIFGAIYLDRSLSLGGLTAREQALLESLAAHASCAVDNRRHFDMAILEPLTGLYTTSYFLERLKDAYRSNNLHGKPFLLLGFFMPTLESSMKDGPRLLGERLWDELQEELPPTSLACWASPILSVLVTELDFGSVDRLAQRIQSRLISMLNCRVDYQILAPEARIPSGVALYYELRRKLLPEESDQQTIMEIRQLLARDITLKDAKRILEKHIIENTLRKTGGNITHAAKELGIHRPQLSNLLKKHELKRERFERGVRLDIGPDGN